MSVIAQCETDAAHYERVELASKSTANIRTIASFCHEEPILKKAKTCLEKPKWRSRKESIKYRLIQGISLLPSVTELSTLIPTIISDIGALTPAFETLDRETKIESDVPDSSDLEKIILQIEAGLKVALVGPSGSGKSSVLALLLRFHHPKEGRVLIDNKNVREYNLRKLKRQIRWGQHEPLLFNYSIRDNIIYGNEGASETEIVKVSREANIHEFACNLPQAYDTVAGERG
ncbi:unnamed protein product [Dovyalis caffra]|uniref:ABC transporter domain-containing protein n=1 Tax=Dovyalis caffra TaxID=77055 RepID=A0AAV1QP02_9ROSI|nr:unnamed protein product [Dovyalis caffra]